MYDSVTERFFRTPGPWIKLYCRLMKNNKIITKNKTHYHRNVLSGLHYVKISPYIETSYQKVAVILEFIFLEFLFLFMPYLASNINNTKMWSKTYIFKPKKYLIY